MGHGRRWEGKSKTFGKGRANLLRRDEQIVLEEFGCIVVVPSMYLVLEVTYVEGLKNP